MTKTPDRLVYDFGTPSHYYCIVKDVYEPEDVDQDTRDAVDDWHYWNGDGGRLG